MAEENYSVRADREAREKTKLALEAGTLRVEAYSNNGGEWVDLQFPDGTEHQFGTDDAIELLGRDTLNRLIKESGGWTDYWGKGSGPVTHDPDRVL